MRRASCCKLPFHVAFMIARCSGCDTCGSDSWPFRLRAQRSISVSHVRHIGPRTGTFCAKTATLCCRTAACAHGLPHRAATYTKTATVAPALQGICGGLTASRSPAPHSPSSPSSLALPHIVLCRHSRRSRCGIVSTCEYFRRSRCGIVSSSSRPTHARRHARQRAWQWYCWV